jgi:hypothetical protein
VEVLKKASTVAAVVAGMMLVGAPAFALSGDHHEHGPGDGYGYEPVWQHDEGRPNTADQFGLVNFGNDSDILSNINLCQTEVNVLGFPILSQNDGKPSGCVNMDNDGN